MALRPPHRSLLRRAAVTAALGALLVPAAGVAPVSAKAKRSKAKLPTVSKVAPMRLAVGDTLTINGKNFLRGRAKNTVVFQRAGAKAVFVKADIGTTKLLKVTIPDRLAGYLLVKDGAPVATRFQLRILAARFGKRFSAASASPLISARPAPGAKPTTPVVAPADGDCDADGQKNGADADDDNDLLPDAVELPLGLDPCKPDSDADGVTDGYEYQSARDLNDDEYQAPNQYLPYPGKRPYPNPLDPSDAGTDYDGDSLTLREEFALWKTFDSSRDLSNLLYSDGQQCSMSVRGPSGRRSCTLTAAEYRSPGSGTRHRQAEFLGWAAGSGYLMTSRDGVSFYDIRDFDESGSVSPSATGSYDRSELEYYDFDGNGVLTDDERDEDGDGLTNFDETRGRGTSGWWAGRYPKEVPYYVTYGGTDLADADSDGDGVRDGADDQDHDDLPNLVELSRNAASGRPIENSLTPPPANPLTPEGFVNPFNPCLPYTGSRTCNTHPPFVGGWAPFGNTEIYHVFN
jgi:hypothetical protein